MKAYDNNTASLKCALKSIMDPTPLVALSRQLEWPGAFIFNIRSVQLSAEMWCMHWWCTTYFNVSLCVRGTKLIYISRRLNAIGNYFLKTCKGEFKITQRVKTERLNFHVS